MASHSADDIERAIAADNPNGAKWREHLTPGLHPYVVARYAQILDAVSDRIAARALTDAADAWDRRDDTKPFVGTWLRARAADLGETRGNVDRSTTSVSTSPGADNQ